MINRKSLIPAVLIVTSILTGGVLVASAQDNAGSANEAGDAQPVQANERGGGFWGKRGHRGHGGHGGHGGMGFGGRGGPEMFMNLFTQVDADKNGSVTQAEIDTFRAAQVTAADGSKDGTLSIEEFDTAYRTLMRPQMVKAFQSFDTDGDGKITAAELDTRLGRVVAQLDRNGDGALSPDDHGRGHHN